MIGNCPRERLEKRASFAREKAGRLLGHLPDGHVLSYQSRDVSKDRYPGAVAGRQNIYSFSAYPGDLDELKMLAVAHRVEDMTHNDVRNALSLRDQPNEYFERSTSFMLERIFGPID